MRGLLGFLGVDASRDLDVTVRHNQGSVPRSLVVNRALMRAAEITRAVTRLGNTGLAARVQRPLLRRSEPLSLVMRHRLLEEFREDIARTGSLIERDLGHWLGRPSAACGVAAERD